MTGAFRIIRDALRLPFRALWRFLDHNGPDRAAAVAYYTLLSLLPMLIFLISVGVAILGSFEMAYQGTLFLIRGVVVHLDDKSMEALHEFVERAQRFQWPGILLLAWTSKRIFSSLLSALEAVFEVRGHRGIAKGQLVALGMVLLTGVGLLATLALTTMIAAAEGFLLRFAPLGSARVLEGMTGFFLARVLPVIITATFFYVVYRFVPGKRVGARAAAAGALLATLLWEGSKNAFAYYVRNLAHYAGVYGALEGIIVLGLWLEVSVSIILYCGEVVALLVGPVTPPSRRAGDLVPQDPVPR